MYKISYFRLITFLTNSLHDKQRELDLPLKKHLALPETLAGSGRKRIPAKRFLLSFGLHNTL